MKRFLSVLLVLATLASALALASAAQSYTHDDTFILGDADGDGLVNAKDALALKCFIAGLSDASINMDAADINADGKATARDSLILMAAFAEQIDLSMLDSDKSIYKLTIAKTDISEFCIVYPEGTVWDSNVCYAAEELQKYVKEAYGVELAICNGEAEATGTRLIRFHPLLNTGSDMETELGFDGYRYEVVDGNLEIYGGLRGNMYAVYDILEQYMGYRFYNGKDTFIYKSRAVDIAADTEYQYIPQLGYRFSEATFGRDNAYSYFYPRKQNGTELYSNEMSYRYGPLTGPIFINAHSFLYYYTMGKGTFTDGAHANECYNEGEAWITQHNIDDPRNKINAYDWQPCATSNEEYEILFSGLLRTMAMLEDWSRVWLKNLSYMSFSINDNGNFCSCRNCNKLRYAEGMSGMYISLTNRACRDIKHYYPDMKLFSIIYDHTIPKTIRPEPNLILMYCGTGCNQHTVGSGGCGDNVTLLGGSNKTDEKALKEWGKMCHDAGAEMWFWEYPVTYHFFLTTCPNIFNFYYDYQYLYNECYVTGICYEGNSGDAGEQGNYLFEPLKAYISSLLMWNIEMSYEQYVANIKDYLYMYYGGGNEEIYDYIVMQNEAGDESGCCFINNYDRPGEMYSYRYLAEHYEQMRALLETALGKVKNDDQSERVLNLIMSCDFMGMSASYNEMYTNGSAESRATFMERYDALYNRIKDKNIQICSELYTLPETISYDVNPMKQFYEYGSRRTDDPNVPW